MGAAGSTPSPSGAPEREAPGKDAKAPADLRRAEPRAMPLIQRFQTRQTAGPGWPCCSPAKTTPILSPFSVFIGTVGADDLWPSLPLVPWQMPLETTREHTDGRESLHEAAPGPTRLSQRVRPGPSAWGGAGLSRLCDLTKPWCRWGRTLAHLGLVSEAAETSSETKWFRGPAVWRTCGQRGHSLGLCHVSAVTYW